MQEQRLERLRSHAWTRDAFVAVIDQFFHGAFQVSLLLRHWQLQRLLQQQSKPRALTLSSAALAVVAVA